MRVTAPSRGFVTLYIVAIAGMFVSFMPFVMVLLPLKVAAVTDHGRVELLSAAALSGAAVASVANIAFGMLSDRSYRLRGTRRGWIAAGLAALVLAYAGFHLSTDRTSLLLSVAGLQVAINMAFSPIMAMMADEVPDAQKGFVSGLMGTGQPIGSLAGAVLVGLPGLDDQARYLLLVAVVVAMVAPFLLLAGERRQPDTAEAPMRVASQRRWDFARAWAARMLVQVAGAALATYGFYYFMRITGETGPKGSGPIAAIMAGATVAGLAATVIAGRLSDRTMRRKPFLAAGAVAMAAGLGTMALAKTVVPAVGGYVLAISGMSVFLGVHAALAMQLLPSPRHRGRDLGVLNLTNTLPAMVAPLLAVYLAPHEAGFGLLLTTLALLTLAGGAAILTVAGEV
jgi:MFS family permease